MIPLFCFIWGLKLRSQVLWNFLNKMIDGLNQIPDTEFLLSGSASSRDQSRDLSIPVSSATPVN